VVLQLPADRAIDGLDIDGEPVPEPRWYLPLYLDPGEHRLAVTAPGKRRTTVSFRVTTSPTDQLVYVPSLADDDGSRPGTVIDPTRRVLGFIGLGAGVAGLAVGTTFGVLAVTADERDPIVRDRATVATVAFVAGAAFAAAGGWLLWSSTRGVRSAMLVPHRNGVALGVTTSF
jgi:hypothetical protein